MPFKDYICFFPNKLGSRVIKLLVQEVFSLYIVLSKKVSKFIFKIYLFIYLFIFKSGGRARRRFHPQSIFFLCPRVSILHNSKFCEAHLTQGPNFKKGTFSFLLTKKLKIEPIDDITCGPIHYMKLNS
jgi:hypothetical protein